MLEGEIRCSGWRVRCLARRSEFLQAKVGARTQVVAGDLLEPRGLV